MSLRPDPSIPSIENLGIKWETGNIRPPSKKKAAKVNEIPTRDVDSEMGGEKTTESSSKNSSQDGNPLSLKNLCAEDRQRIATLIQELIKVGEEKEKVENQLANQRSAFEQHSQQLLATIQQLAKDKKVMKNQLQNCESELEKCATIIRENSEKNDRAQLRERASKEKVRKKEATEDIAAGSRDVLFGIGPLPPPVLSSTRQTEDETTERRRPTSHQAPARPIKTQEKQAELPRRRSSSPRDEALLGEKRKTLDQSFCELRLDDEAEVKNAKPVTKDAAVGPERVVNETKSLPFLPLQRDLSREFVEPRRLVCDRNQVTRADVGVSVPTPTASRTATPEVRFSQELVQPSMSLPAEPKVDFVGQRKQEIAAQQEELAAERARLREVLLQQEELLREKQRELSDEQRVHSGRLWYFKHTGSFPPPGYGTTSAPEALTTPRLDAAPLPSDAQPVAAGPQLGKVTFGPTAGYGQPPNAGRNWTNAFSSRQAASSAIIGASQAPFLSSVAPPPAGIQMPEIGRMTPRTEDTSSALVGGVPPMQPPIHSASQAPIYWNPQTELYYPMPNSVGPRNETFPNSLKANNAYDVASNGVLRNSSPLVGFEDLPNPQLEAAPALQPLLHDQSMALKMAEVDKILKSAEDVLKGGEGHSRDFKMADTHPYAGRNFTPRDAPTDAKNNLHAASLPSYDLGLTSEETSYGKAYDPLATLNHIANVGNDGNPQQLVLQPSIVSKRENENGVKPKQAGSGSTRHHDDNKPSRTANDLTYKYSASLLDIIDDLDSGATSFLTNKKSPNKSELPGNDESQMTEDEKNESELLDSIFFIH